MTKKEMIQQQLNEMGVTVFQCPGLQTRRAICTQDGYLGLADMESSAEECTVLEHERQHYALSAFYRPDASLYTRLRLEGMVDRATILSLVDRQRLAEALRAGLSCEEIAESFSVTPDFLQEAYAYYKALDPDYCTDPEW